MSPVEDIFEARADITRDANLANRGNVVSTHRPGVRRRSTRKRPALGRAGARRGKDRHGNRVIPLSDGTSLDVRRLKAGLIAIFQACGNPVRSVSDFQRNPLTDRLFGEDDRPPSEEEIIEIAEDMIAHGAKSQKLIEFVESKNARRKTNASHA